jgi:hypothetical protein
MNININKLRKKHIIIELFTVIVIAIIAIILLLIIVGFEELEIFIMKTFVDKKYIATDNFLLLT